AHIRWTDKGEESVRGGRYRFISPVFRQDECVDLGESKVKPQHLINAALTNDPNISGMTPLSNSKAPAPVLENRIPTSEMEDDQRKAMFAKMGQGGGGGGGGGGARRRTGNTPVPEKLPPQYTPDYSSNRNFEARIAAMEEQRRVIEAQAPQEPELKTFDKINVRAMERELILSGASFADIKKQVDAAKEKNRAVQKELHDIKKRFKAKYTDPQKQKAAIEAYFDKIDQQNKKAMDAYAAKKMRFDSRLSGIDRQIDMEKIRWDEAST
ncbi:MAG: hypothetical protein HGB17_15200, partial [Syntrophobacteraceae bacterium]|nr:hypothetical protein [Syntrophobacteraceae bacterium]